MKRDIIHHLEAWKDSPTRVPAILRGARQVGKSWVVRDFARSFDSFVTFNFEKNTEIHEIFTSDLSVDPILGKLRLYAKEAIIPGRTLLFFDEVQACPRALLALRYFKEECPDLHVIAAGSLLDFILESVGMPVGRVQFFHMHPLSFGEFLEAGGHHAWREHLVASQESAVIHQKLWEQFQLYSWLGGMPEVLQTWFDSGDAQLCQAIQERILHAYQQDFLKYAKGSLVHPVDTVFSAVPQQLGQKFKYVQADPNQRAAVLREALALLQKAGVVHVAYHTSAQALPLAGAVNAKRFKVFYFDTGLVQCALGVDMATWLKQPLSGQTKGALAEQWVAQELVAYQSVDQAPALFYWHREEKFSEAEIDFVTVKDGQIIPVEVKSGAQGRMKSLHYFLDSHPNTPYGLKISAGDWGHQDRLMEIPLYGVEAWLKGVRS